MKLYFKVLAAGAILVETYNFANAMFGRTTDPLLKGTTRHLRSIRPSLTPHELEKRAFHASSRRSFPMGGTIARSKVLSAIKPNAEVIVEMREKTELPLAVKVLMGASIVPQNDIPIVDQPKDTKPAAPKATFIAPGGPIGC